MAQKTIPQLNEISSIDENAVIPVDTGIQSYKITAPNLAKSLDHFIAGGVWNATKEYKIGDEVLHGGKVWRCVQDGTNMVPNANEGTYWVLSECEEEFDWVKWLQPNKWQNYLIFGGNIASNVSISGSDNPYGCRSLLIATGGAGSITTPLIRSSKFFKGFGILRDQFSGSTTWQGTVNMIINLYDSNKNPINTMSISGSVSGIGLERVVTQSARLTGSAYYRITISITSNNDAYITYIGKYTEDQIHGGDGVPTGIVKSEELIPSGLNWTSLGGTINNSHGIFFGVTSVTATGFTGTIWRTTGVSGLYGQGSSLVIPTGTGGATSISSVQILNSAAAINEFGRGALYIYVGHLLAGGGTTYIRKILTVENWNITAQATVTTAISGSWDDILIPISSTSYHYGGYTLSTDGNATSRSYKHLSAAITIGQPGFSGLTDRWIGWNDSSTVLTVLNASYVSQSTITLHTNVINARAKYYSSSGGYYSGALYVMVAYSGGVRIFMGSSILKTLSINIHKLLGQNSTGCYALVDYVDLNNVKLVHISWEGIVTKVTAFDGSSSAAGLKFRDVNKKIEQDCGLGIFDGAGGTLASGTWGSALYSHFFVPSSP